MCGFVDTPYVHLNMLFLIIGPDYLIGAKRLYMKKPHSINYIGNQAIIALSKQ